MGAVASTVSSSWRGFSGPARGMVFLSAMLWMYMQSRRLPGLVVYALATSVTTPVKRLLGLGTNPAWPVSQEVSVNVMRRLLATQRDSLRSTLNLVGKTPLHNLPLRAVRLHEFNGYWAGSAELSRSDTIVVLWLHGGGYIVGDPLQSVMEMDRLRQFVEARKRSLAILTVDYPLAPEHPYPAAPTACFNAYRYLIESMNVSPNRVVIAGDSAGGALALSVAVQCRARQVPPPAALVLVSPWVDLRQETPSYVRNAPFDYLGSTFLTEGSELYLQGTPANPLSSPALLSDLSGLPSSLIFAGEREVFYDDIVAFAGRLTEAGVATELVTNSQGVHNWAWLLLMHEAHALGALEKMADYIVAHTDTTELETV